MSSEKKIATQTKRIIIRCSQEQREKIFLNAELTKQNVTQYLLAVALNQPLRSAEEHKKIEVLLQLKADLARLGNLFKLCLDRGESRTELFNDTLKNIKEISSKIGEFLEKELR